MTLSFSELELWSHIVALITDGLASRQESDRFEFATFFILGPMNHFKRHFMKGLFIIKLN